VGPQGIQGLTGPAGAVGPIGPAGTAGVSGLEVIEHESPTWDSPTNGTIASCPSGKAALGGGAYTYDPLSSDTDANTMVLTSSYPMMGTVNGKQVGVNWHAEAQRISNNHPWSVIVWVICADVH
jgi:hypothetical protein